MFVIASFSSPKSIVLFSFCDRLSISSINFFFIRISFNLFEFYLNFVQFTLNSMAEQQQQNNLPLNQDPTSPFYIHPSENQTVSLVSQPFNGENYGDWKRSVVIALSAKNKLGFVDGRIKKPAANDPSFSAWQRCNDLIISYFLRSVDSSIARSILYFSTAEEIWKDLEDRFSQSSGPQLFSLQ